MQTLNGSSWFCSHCAKRPRTSLANPLARVCDACSVGTLFEAENEAVPGFVPFIVVDADLTIVAVSELAERLLHVYEQDATGHYVTEFLVQAEAIPGEDNFAVAISQTASAATPIHYANVRVRRQRSLTAQLRIAVCGPPRAALVVFTDCNESGQPLDLWDESAAISY